MRRRTPFLLRWYVVVSIVYLGAVILAVNHPGDRCGKVVLVVPDKHRAYVTIDDGKATHVAIVPLDMITQAQYGAELCTPQEWILSTTPR